MKLLHQSYSTNGVRPSALPNRPLRMVSPFYPWKIAGFGWKERRLPSVEGGWAKSRSSTRMAT